MFHVFPQGLEGTLVIPIFVGILVMAALTEAWGWDFVGVVVPGYLASVALLQPTVAAVVVLEAGATFALAAALDRGLTAARLSFPVFGRERFFLILVASVAVRVALEGYVLQPVAVRLSGVLPGLEAHRHELFGIGLVLVPLTANRLWASGPARGSFQLAVQVGLVALFLRFVLIPFTNFALAGFDPTYDPLALSFLTSPRAQMALLVTAAVASAWNRRYGWDYHGILVPALLGLTVLSPVKLLATVVEAVVVLLLARSLLRLPHLRTLNVEGARRLVLCFCVGLMFKMAVARLALAQLPGYRPTDLLGFGYVLPSLLAERIWRKESALLVFLPTLQAALAGFLLTAASAGALALVAPAPPVAPALFPTLRQAVAAWPGLAESGRLSGAETADGYRVHFDPALRGLVALRDGAKRAVLAPLDEQAGIAAIRATRAGAALLLGEEAAGLPMMARLGLSRTAQAAPAATFTRSQEPGPALARRAVTASPQPMSPEALALAEDAALAIDRERDDPRRLAVAVEPFGLRVTVASDGTPLLAGPGWPTVLLRPAARIVVAAAHASEWGTPGAALLACQTLEADCVLPHDQGGPAVRLAAALAQRRRRPLALVRGTLRPLGADALLLASPEPAPGQAPPWMEPLLAVLRGRLTVTRRAGPDLGPLRAFPPGSARLGPTALLWLSPFARRVMSGADQTEWAGPALQELARRRGLSLVHADGARWVSAGRAAPDAAALARAELMARTGDVAMLGPRAAAARVALLIDDVHGVAALAVEQGDRRALIVGGERAEERVPVASLPGAEAALRQGARTLLAAEGAR